jgi:hypothetical protein
MLIDRAQRWRDRRASYRPAGETINPLRFDVSELEDDRTAKNFVQAHHYSGSYPAARFRYGLWTGGHLVGVAVFSVPANDAALAVLPGAREEGVELGRFVLLDQVPANGETWFLARAFECLRWEGLAGVVSFSDPVSRTNLAGEIIFPGHLGVIYRAHNAVYLGRARARIHRLLPDGTVFSPRAIQKIRSGEQGWRYAAAQLERWGAEPLQPWRAEDRISWLEEWLPKLTRPLRHKGNLKYAWALNRAGRRHLPASLPYPSWDELRSAA